jgi:phenylalanyl-tRNA synthetase beta chain
VVSTSERSEPMFHPGRTARVAAGLDLHGIVGELHPAIARDLDLGPVVLGELSIVGLSGGQVADVRTTPPPRHPAVERDLAVIVAQDLPASAVADSIRRHAGPLLSSVSLFDVYRGTPLAADEKSLAHRLTFQAADRTLTDDEIDAAIASITDGLRADTGGRLRS